jgi:hypothetical protein
MADNDVASLSDVFIQLHGPGGFADQLGKSPPCAEILYSVYSRDAERCWGASMLGMCLWIAIGAACGGAFVGGLLVLWSVRAP